MDFDGRHLRWPRLCPIWPPLLKYLEVWGLEGLGFRVQGLGLRVWDLGFRVLGVLGTCHMGYK